MKNIARNLTFKLPVSLSGLVVRLSLILALAVTTTGCIPFLGGISSGDMLAESKGDQGNDASDNIGNVGESRSSDRLSFQELWIEKSPEYRVHWEGDLGVRVAYSNSEREGEWQFPSRQLETLTPVDWTQNLEIRFAGDSTILATLAPPDDHDRAESGRVTLFRDINHTQLSLNQDLWLSWASNLMPLVAGLEFKIKAEMLPSSFSGKFNIAKNESSHQFLEVQSITSSSMTINDRGTLFEVDVPSEAQWGSKDAISMVLNVKINPQATQQFLRLPVAFCSTANLPCSGDGQYWEYGIPVQ